MSLPDGDANHYIAIRKLLESIFNVRWEAKQTLFPHKFAYSMYQIPSKMF